MATNKLVVKRRNNWKRHQSKVILKIWNKYLDYLIDPSFQEVDHSNLVHIEQAIKNTFF